jgi:glycosyltransferase involved in cell wall biosynthesis
VAGVQNGHGQSGAAGAPLVSILTPSFEQGRFLRDCLDSVARQTYPAIEQVVVDGGSTDETLSVLAAAGDGVRWTSEPDRGQADAVNKAFERSSGEIVGWLNSDDGLFAADTVERVVAAFQRHPGVDVVFGDAAFVDESGLIVRHYRSRWRARGRLPLTSPISQPAAFLRRSALEPAEPLLRADLHRKLDYELWLRLRSRGARFRHVPFVVAVDRDHSLRKSRTLDEPFVQEAEDLLREYGPILRYNRLRRAGAFVRRVQGLGAVLTWERHTPAFPWHVDGRLRRALRQLTLTHPVQLGPRERRIGRAPS